MAGALPLFTGCMPGQQEIAPPPEPEGPRGGMGSSSTGIISISVDKMVKVEGGDTWEEEVEQCVCQNVEFQIIVSNDGEEPLNNIGISDLIPSGLEYISGSAVPSPTPDPPNPPYCPCWFFDGPLNSGDDIEITFSAHVASEGEHTNCVSVFAETYDWETVWELDCAVVVGITCECEPKMHYPQYPDVYGWDVYSCFLSSIDYPQLLQVADDWQCTESGPITHIRFWGSWKDDVEGQITGFHIEIYSNIPEDGDYSHPGDLLWDAFITNYSSEAFQLAAFEGWYNPKSGSNDDDNHYTYYRYDITDIDPAFDQEAGEIYWLSIWPWFEAYENERWGWKSSQDHWMDDACWSSNDLPYHPQDPVSPQYSEYYWYEIYEPTPVVQSLDLAFVICGGEEPCKCEDYWNEIEISWTDESGVENSYTSHCGDTVDVPGHITPLLGTPIEIITSIGCVPSPPCSEPIYHWEVTEVGPGPAFSDSDDTLPVSFTPTATGWNIFEVALNATCGGEECPPCTLIMRVNPQPGGKPSISVDKLVSADGGASWHEEVEQDVCQNVQFQITVTNDGDVPLSNIVISDYLPDCLEYVDGPAVELCRTQEPPYWNISGTNTPTWKCSELAPGNSVQVIYTAHVVESGICKNQVSVDGEYNGDIAHDEYVAYVIGLETRCQCGDWSPIEITWDDGNPRTTDSVTIPCNTSTWLTSLKGEQVYVTASIDCIPPSCELNYSWGVTPPQGQSPVSGYSSGGELEFWFDGFVEGVYEVTLNATCYNVECPPCTFNIDVSLD